MSVRVWDAKCYIDEDDSMLSSSTQDRGLFINSDTIRLSQQRTITNSNDSGYPGELCHNSNYIYVCVATDTWKRCALSTW